MGTTNIDKVKERVQKLLNQAADRAGTAEGEVFYQKAFDLMAAYGFEERDLRNHSDADEVIMRTFALSGAYTDMQASLLLNVCSALHCVAYMESARRSRKVSAVTAFGLRRHVERAEMLYAVLNPQMAAGAQQVSGNRVLGVATVVARRSYMGGFISVVADRLQAAEGSVAAGKRGVRARAHGRPRESPGRHGCFRRGAGHHIHQPRIQGHRARRFVPPRRQRRGIERPRPDPGARPPGPAVLAAGAP